jgi:hypothetical protein
MEAQEPGLIILHDDVLTGPAAIVDELAQTEEEQIALELQNRLRKQGVALPGARGLWDEFRRIVAKLRGRQLVSDLGVHEVRVDWMGFHVPPGGSASLKFETTASQEEGVQLKFMGLGFGSGRSISLASEQDFGDRERCFYLGVKLAVHLQTYAEDDGEDADSLQVDVVNVLGSYLRAPESCSLCFASPDHAPRRAQRTGREWDLTEDTRGLTETETFEFGEESELEVGLNIPIAGLDKFTPAVALSRKVSSRCVASYEFSGQACFTAYQLVGARKDFPFWGKT